MKIAHAAILAALAFAVTPAPGAEMDHSAMDHTHLDHASGDPAAQEMASPVEHGADNTIRSYTLLDQLEVRGSDPRNELGWDLQGWIGTDLARLWVRSEGETVSGHRDAADLEVMYGRSISTWWDLVAGLRHDFGPADAQTSGAIGIQGLAPQRIELAATAYIGQGGQSTARLKAEYELLLASRLVLQSRVEADLHGKTDAARGAGSGLSTVQAGLRLRYEFTRQFAPYVGVDWERAFGATADLRRATLTGVEDGRLVAGVRLWF